MKNKRMILWLSLVILLLASVVRGEDNRSLSLINNSTYYVSSTEALYDGGQVTFYTNGHEIRVLTLKPDGQKDVEKSFVNTQCSSCDLYGSGIYSRENGQDFFYLFGDSPHGASAHNGFITKLDKNLNEIGGRLYLVDFYSVGVLCVVNGSYLLVSGTSQSGMISLAQVGFDKIRGYTQFYNATGNPSGMVQNNNFIVIAGYEYGNTGKILKVDLSTGNLLKSKTYEGAGTEIELRAIYKTNSGFILSGVKGYTMAERAKGWIFSVDSDLENFQSVKQFNTEVNLCGTDGGNFILRVGTYNNSACTYNKIEASGNILSNFDFMTGSYGQLIKGSNGAYYGAGRKTDGSGVWAYYMPAVNNAPTVSAGGNRTVIEGSNIVLVGSGSDVDGDSLTYLWTQLAGPTAGIIVSTAKDLSFVAPSVGSGGATLEFQLTVSDGNLTATDTCVVNVTNNNQAPVASAGADQTVKEGTTVNLTGSGNDPDGDTLTYQWIQTSGPTVTLANANSASPSFIAPNVTPSGATLGFQVTVSDGSLTATDTCIVNITNNNQAPVASAGPDQSVKEGATVNLNGSGNDPDGDTLTYQWIQTSGPTVTLANANSTSPSFVAPSVDSNGANLGFQLTVSDGSLTATSTCTVAVGDVPVVVVPPTPDPVPEFGSTTEGDFTVQYKTAEVKSVNINSGSGKEPKGKTAPSMVPEIGLLDIDVELVPGVTTTTIIVSLPVAIPKDCDWWKLEKGEWVNYTARGRAVFDSERKKVAITLTDGGEGDNDGVENGWIQDPSGAGKMGADPVTPTTPAAPADGGKGGGGGCFIETSMISNPNSSDSVGYKYMIILSVIAIVAVIRKKVV